MYVKHYGCGLSPDILTLMRLFHTKLNFFTTCVYTMLCHVVWKSPMLENMYILINVTPVF